ncbi:MAG: alpha/beta fold hydrolase [Chloroflexi bacterium]|nr:alpha/beta fold hydrolase [Chloroflexota bacterium]
MSDALSAPGAQTTAIRRELVSTRFGQVHVRLSGQSTSRAPIVLLHMNPMSAAMYDRLLPLFGRDRLAIAPDRLGFGFSDTSPRPLSMAEYALSSLDVLDHLGVQRFDIYGTHTGSVEAVELAGEHADRVRRVVLVSIPAYTPQELEERKYRLAGVPEPAEDGSHLQWHWRRRFLHRQAPHDLALFQWRLLQELLAGPNSWWPYKAVFDYPMAERLARLEQPVLVLAPHDDLWQQTVRVYSSGGLPSRARFVDLPHLGLDIAYFATDEVVTLVRDFLDR